VLGSSRFVGPLRARVGPLVAGRTAPEARPLAALNPEVISTAAVDYDGLGASALSRRHDVDVARAVDARLCRRHTEVTRRELAARLGLSDGTSVPNLTRRLDVRLENSPRLAVFPLDLRPIMP
jgi:hypothetical protein